MCDINKTNYMIKKEDITPIWSILILVFISAGLIAIPELTSVSCAHSSCPENITLSVHLMNALCYTGGIVSGIFASKKLKKREVQTQAYINYQTYLNKLNFFKLEQEKEINK